MLGKAPQPWSAEKNDGTTDCWFGSQVKVRHSWFKQWVWVQLWLFKAEKLNRDTADVSTVTQRSCRRESSRRLQSRPYKWNDTQISSIDSFRSKSETQDHLLLTTKNWLDLFSVFVSVVLKWSEQLEITNKLCKVNKRCVPRICRPPAPYF